MRSTDRRLLAAALALGSAVALVCAPGAWIRSTHGNQTSSDEPHYLVTALSIARDGDLDTANQVDDGAYRSFHEQALLEQAAPDARGRRVVPHDPLLPAVLALPMALGGWLAARLALALVAGATAAMALWLAVARFGARLGPAAATIAVTAGSATMVAYGTQVFPEMPAALAVLVAVAAASAPSQRPGRALGPGGVAAADAVVVVAVVALPWLAVKYVPVAGAIALLHLWRRLRTSGVGVLAVLGAAWAVAAGLYAVLHLRWYGGVTVYAAGAFFQDRGSQLSVVGTQVDLLGRARRLVGLLVGRDFGIATWQPAWLFGVAALAWIARPPAGLASRWPRFRGRRRPWHVAAGDWLASPIALLVVPVAVGWLVATFVALTMQGWWFPGRQVVVVLPLVAVAMAVAASQLRWLRVGVVVSGLAGLVTTGWLLVDGLAGRLTMIVDFALAGSPVLAVVRTAMPDYLDVTAGTWLRHGAWLAVVVGLGLVGWRAAGRRPARAWSGEGQDRDAPPGQPPSASVVDADAPSSASVVDADPDELDESEPASVPDPDSSPEPSSSRTSAPSSDELQAVAPSPSTATAATAATEERDMRMGRGPRVRGSGTCQ